MATVKGARPHQGETAWRRIDGRVGLWTCEYPVEGFGKSRCTALRLVDGGVLVVSPGATLDEFTLLELNELGRPSVLLAPNGFHHLGIPSWRERYPWLAVVASARTRGELACRGIWQVEPLEHLAGLLPPGAEVLQPPGLRTGEAWLRVATERGVAWIVGDALFNLTMPPRGVRGALLRRAGLDVGLRMTPLFRLAAVRDKALLGSWWMLHVEADRPRLLLPAHGDVYVGDDLTDRLREIARDRLSS